MNEIKITVEGLKELTEALQMLAGVKAQPVQGLPVQQPQMQVPIQQVAPMQQVPTQQSAPIQQAPVQQMSTMQQAGMVPTTTAVQGYTIEQLQVAAAGLMSAGKGPQVMGILQRFGIQAMTELPKEQYGNFGAALREAGAQI